MGHTKLVQDHAGRSQSAARKKSKVTCAMFSGLPIAWIFDMASNTCQKIWQGPEMTGMLVSHFKVPRAFSQSHLSVCSMVSIETRFAIAYQNAEAMAPKDLLVEWANQTWLKIRPTAPAILNLVKNRQPVCQSCHVGPEKGCQSMVRPWHWRSVRRPSRANRRKIALHWLSPLVLPWSQTVWHTR